MMKVLYVSDVYFPRVNGVSTSISTFRRELRAHGHTVHLIAPDYYMPSDDESEITRVPSRRLPLDPEDRMLKQGVVMRELERLRAENYDLVHIQTPFVAHYLGVKLARLLGIPCVETYHTFFEEYLHYYVPFLPKALMRGVARRFSRMQCNRLDGIVVPSHPMLEVLRDYGVTAQAQVIPTGLEPESFVAGDGASFRAKYDIGAAQPVLLFVGRVAHEKNIDFLLRMHVRLLQEVPDALLVIAGEGPAREHLRTLAAELGIVRNVRFIGYLDRHTELNDCYSAGDVFVFSSRTETQGLVLLEAMAQGTAVVSTAEMGTRDVLQDGVGVWVVPETIEEFAAKTVRLLRDQEARRILGAGGREYARLWSASVQAERMSAFYGEIISRRRLAITACAILAEQG